MHPRHPDGCECDAYACELRRKGVQISSAATIRRNTSRGIPTLKVPDAPSWERGLAPVTHRNADGTVVPVVNADGTPLRVKQYSEQRAKIDDKLAAMRHHVDTTQSQ